MDAKNEYYFKEGCFIDEWHNSEHDEQMSVVRVRVEVGQTTKLHALKDTTERYIILSGTALVTIGNEQKQIMGGDVVVIDPDVPQCIENLGQRDLLFLAVCTPRFREQNYREC